MTEQHLALTWDSVGESLANQIEQHAAGTYKEITGIESCKYFSTATGQAACILGRVFADHGMDIHWVIVDSPDLPNPINRNERRLGCLVDDQPDWFAGVPKNLIHYLEKVQFLQDNGFTWYDAVNMARTWTFDDLMTSYAGMDPDDAPKVTDPASESYRLQVKQLLEDLRGPFPVLVEPVPNEKEKADAVVL